MKKICEVEVSDGTEKEVYTAYDITDDGRHKLLPDNFNRLEYRKDGFGNIIYEEVGIFISKSKKTL